MAGLQAIPPFASNIQSYASGSSSITTTPTTDSTGWRRNPNYIVTLYDNSPDLVLGTNIVQAYIPEQFHFRVQNAWEPFLTSLGNLESTIETINTPIQLSGSSLNFKFLSALVWRRMEPIEFEFTFLFDSGNGLNGNSGSALNDVTIPVMNLIAMATPKRGTGSVGQFTLTAPGPTLTTPNSNISMKIGRFFYVDSVVIDGLDIVWHTMAEGSGDFIAADVTVSFKGWYSPDRNDILSYFGQGDTGVAAYIKSQPQNFANTASGGQAPPVYDLSTSSNIWSAIQKYYSGTTSYQSDTFNQFKNQSLLSPQNFTTGGTQ